MRPASDEVRWDAALVVEFLVQWDPPKIPVELLLTMTNDPLFSVRSSAAVSYYYLAGCSPGVVPVQVLGRMASVFEDWYVMMPATSALLRLARTRDVAVEVLASTISHENKEARDHAAYALKRLANVYPAALRDDIADRIIASGYPPLVEVGETWKQVIEKHRAMGETFDFYMFLTTLVAAVGSDGFGLITHRDQYLVTAQRYAASKAHRRGARRMSARGTRRGIRGRSAREMDDERFLNSYHNASTPPGPDVPADLVGFMLAADPVLGDAAELSRVLARAHQGAATQLFGEDWAHARKYFSLSEKYAAWADYNTPARGFGIHANAHKVHRPIRLTDEALRAHPDWRNFGSDEGRHPPMRGWLAVPLIGSDGENYGFIQVSDRLEGDFTAQDEANLLRLASLTATALDALARLHLPGYRAKVADPGQ